MYQQRKALAKSLVVVPAHSSLFSQTHMSKGDIQAFQNSCLQEMEMHNKKSAKKVFGRTLQAAHHHYIRYIPNNDDLTFSEVAHLYIFYKYFQFHSKTV